LSGNEFRPTKEALSFLLSAEGKTLLAQLAAEEVNEASLLSHTERLRSNYPSAVAAAALDLSLLRKKARAKFSRADEMFFTREALEQASAEVVSRYRAQRFAPYSRVADLCCGIGGDALALAKRAEVVALDVDPVRARMAQANAAVYGVGDRVRAKCEDATAYTLAAGSAAWADPSRRVAGRRVYTTDAYRPSLATLLKLTSAAPGTGIKLSPGVDYSELDARVRECPYGERPYEVEIVSVRGEAREAVLWLGELCTARRRATLLPGEHTLVARPLAERVPVTSVARYLYEPDAAVIRAHLVEHLAASIGAHKIDEQIAYLTADRLVKTPFASAYRVEASMPFGLKRINRHLRTMDVGELVIKKRGLAIDPEQFRRRLKYGARPLSGGRQNRVILVLTRLRDQPAALICRQPAALSAGPHSAL
jgi:SAM-dependent methyltransferase